jgi:hypothetical protein
MKELRNARVDAADTTKSEDTQIARFSWIAPRGGGGNDPPEKSLGCTLGFSEGSRSIMN